MQCSYPYIFVFAYCDRYAGEPPLIVGILMTKLIAEILLVWCIRKCLWDRVAFAIL